MPDARGPVTTRKRLRIELNRLREGRGLSQAQVIENLDWSLSKLIRIENGSVGVSVTDVRALLGLYKAPEDSIDELVSLARIARERRWWSGYRDTLSPQYQEFIGFEAEAVRLRQFHPTLVPGLLQTEAYIRAVTEALMLSPQPQSQFTKFVEVRLRRQAEVLHGENPPEFTVIIDEAALLRPVGGADVMRAQLLQLAKLADEEIVSIAVLPFSAGAHIGMLGAFHIMDFADDADDSVLYVENSRQGDVALKDEDDVAMYSRQFDQLLERSLRTTDAISLIMKNVDRFGAGD